MGEDFHDVYQKSLFRHQEDVINVTKMSTMRALINFPGSKFVSNNPQ